MLHATRIITSKCDVLSILLAQAEFPWIKIVRSDLKYVYDNHRDDLFRVCYIYTTGDHMYDPHLWEELLVHTRWPDVVALIFYTSSLLDREVSQDASVRGIYVSHLCACHQLCLQPCPWFASTCEARYEKPHW